MRNVIPMETKVEGNEIMTLSSNKPTVRLARSTGRARTSVGLPNATALESGGFNAKRLEHSTCYSTLPAKMLFFGVNEK